MSTCILPGGYADDSGAVHDRAELAPLSGREEELMAQAEGRTLASILTSVLSRCVIRLGSISPLSQELARDLLVGDRHYLLLKLREATFGDLVRGHTLCPWPDCGQKIDIEFRLRDIPVKTSEHKGPEFSLKLSPAAAYLDPCGHAHQDVVFRLPRGSDQEALAVLAYENYGLAETLLLQRCIQKIGPYRNNGVDLVNDLSPLARLEIEEHMADLAPMLELNMEADCPVCKREFTLPFDLQEFFLKELGIRPDLLYREVHYLAYHYHWSESEILNLPRVKRRRYIEILGDEISRLNDEAEL